MMQKAFDARSAKVNKIEKIKHLKSPKEAYEALTAYAHKGYDAIPEEDKGYFLKCFGIYDRPATPGRFMVRVRIPGGQLSQEQAVAIGEAARDYGHDYIDITTRMQVELRYLRIEDIPALIKKLENVGISLFQTGVDNVRNIMNDPLDGLSHDNILPSQALLQRLQQRFMHNWEWVGALPRKFNTAISGSISNRCNVFGHDCCFVLAQREGVYGYNLYLGGKVGKIAKSAGIFLKNEKEAEACFAALMELFRDYGFRDNRNKNRLYHLIDVVGMHEITAALRKTSGIDFAPAGITMTQMDFFDPDQGRIQLRNGTFAVHAVIPSGVFSGSDMLAAADASRTFGDGRLRIDVEQSLYITGVHEEALEPLSQHAFFRVYKSVDSPYFNHMVACAGTEHCPFGVIANKPDAIAMSRYLSTAVPLDEGRIRLYWSACVKGCGLHGIGDIGFEGCKVKVDGENEGGVHISIGGKLSGEGAEGYSVLKSVPLRYARFYVESLAGEYRRLKKPHESFESFHDRVLSNYSPACIGFMMQLQAYLRHKKIDIAIGFETNAVTAKTEAFELFRLGCRLYFLLVGTEPYSAVERFAPRLNEKLQPITKTDCSIDVPLAEAVYRMIHPDPQQRAGVFSELQGFIGGLA